MASRTSAESVLSAHVPQRTHRTRLHRLVAVVASGLALVASTLAGTVVTGAVAPASATTNWSAMGSGTNGAVLALATDASGNVYAGGQFTMAGGVAANYIAKWSPSTNTWSAVGGGVPNPVNALVVDASGNLYAAGYVPPGTSGWVARWDGSTWTSLGAATGAVRALAVGPSGTLYAGGEFGSVGGVTANTVAQWDGTTWAAMGGGFGRRVYALATDSTGRVYAGGQFSQAHWGPYDYIAQWDPTTSTWDSMGTGMNGTVKALLRDSSDHIYAGGEFSTAGGVSVDFIAKWDPTANAGAGAWSGLNGGTNSYVTALARDGLGNVYAGGSFTLAGNGSADCVAKWDGTAWSPVGSGVSGSIYSLTATASGAVYLGGTFTSVGSVIATLIASWVPPVPGPSVSTASLAAATVGTAYSQTVAATGGVSPYTWSVASGSLPAGLSLNASTGVISGTPTTAGSSSFTVQVADSQSTPATATASLSITTGIAPLSVTTSALANATVGTSYLQTLAATGGTSPYTWSVTSGSLPAGLALDPSTGDITGTPTTTGSSSFTVEVTDSQSTPATATASLSITTSLPSLAVSTSSLLGATDGTAYTETLVATGGTSPYSWAVTSGSLPAGLTLDPSTGVISGTPTAAGTSSFTVDVTDSQGTPATATASLSIVVAAASSNSNGGGNSNSSNGGSNSSSSSNPSAGVAAVSAEEDVRRPSPVLFSVLALGDACPSGWSGPSWESWPNGGLGGRVCNKRIEWSVAQGAYEVDPVDALLSARVWQDRILRVIHRMV